MTDPSDQDVIDYMRTRVYRCGQCEGVSSREMWDNAWWTERGHRHHEDPLSDEAMVCPRCRYVHHDDSTGIVEEVWAYVSLTDTSALEQEITRLREVMARHVATGHDQFNDLRDALEHQPSERP
jgi:hypothetical protein